ncbi:uncharacterized protein AKAME5_001418400 [Lates japonicus]|uniref:Uncharacterized protein n=1 Tax=Lates japonicus TaxID=270547 RepID=A0AAD3MZD1_LATJO|nr:uncharacterized protein AKAME5_001418400 [Lates japonicus]
MMWTTPRSGRYLWSQTPQSTPSRDLLTRDSPLNPLQSSESGFWRKKQETKTRLKAISVEGLPERNCMLFTLTSSTVHCHLSLRGETSLWRELWPGEGGGQRIRYREIPPQYNHSPRTSFSSKESRALIG